MPVPLPTSQRRPSAPAVSTGSAAKARALGAGKTVAGGT